MNDGPDFGHSKNVGGKTTDNKLSGKILIWFIQNTKLIWLANPSFLGTVCNKSIESTDHVASVIDFMLSPQRLDSKQPT